MSMLNQDYLDTEVEFPLVVYGSLPENFKVPPQVKLVSSQTKINHEKPYICVYVWEDFFPDKIGLLYESVRKQHHFFSKILVYLDEKNLKKDYRSFFRELGVEKLVEASSSGTSLEGYLKNQVYEAEKIGSDYCYMYQLGKLIGGQNLDKLKDELDKLVIVELLNPKTILLIKALLVIGQNLKAKVLLKKVLTADPECLWAAQQLSMAYLKDGEYGPMLELMERLNKYHGYNPQRIYYLGNTHFYLDNYQRSLYFFRDGCKRFPQFATRFNEGIAKNMLVLDFDLADVMATIGEKELSHDFLDFLSCYAKRFFAKKKFKQTLSLLRLALKGTCANQCRAGILYNLSVVNGMIGQSRASQECFEKCVSVGGRKISQIGSLEQALLKAQTQQAAQWQQVFAKEQRGLISFSPRDFANREHVVA